MLILRNFHIEDAKHPIFKPVRRVVALMALNALQNTIYLSSTRLSI